MAAPTKTFYLFHGTDDIAIDEAVERLRASMGEFGEMNTSDLDGETATMPEVLNDVSSYPFLGDKRLVIVKGLVAHLTRKGAGETGKRGLEQLIAEAPTLPEHARLVLVERGLVDEKNKLLQTLNGLPNGFVRAYNVPADLTGWIDKRAEQYGAEVEPRAAEALANLVGSDLRRLDNELVKLADYALPRTVITEDDVAALTPYVAEANIFQMVDAMSSGDARTALRLLHRLLLDKNNTIFSVYGMIQRQFRMLILAREHLDNGGGSGLSSVLGVRPFAADSFARQARAFTMADLEAIYHKLLDTDIAMKTGEMDPELAVDLLITSLKA
jgi:DNA polymerase-3 subunit delta